MKEPSITVLEKDEVIKQVVGKIVWRDYLRLQEFCVFNKRKQKDVIVQAIKEFLDRQKR